jgi:hypothetical protein
VCIGSACSMSGREEPHVWVMTLEPSTQECLKLAAQGKPVREQDRVVRFWETTNGRAYTLKGRFAADAVTAVSAGGDEKGALNPVAEEEEEEVGGGAAAGGSGAAKDGPPAERKTDAETAAHNKNLEAVKLLERRSKLLSDTVKKLTGEVDPTAPTGSAGAAAKAEEKYGSSKERRAAREKAEREAAEQAARDAEELSPEREKADDTSALVESAYSNSSLPLAAAAAAAGGGAGAGGAGSGAGGPNPNAVPKAGGVKMAGGESLFDSKLYVVSVLLFWGRGEVLVSQEHKTHFSID